MSALASGPPIISRAKLVDYLLSFHHPRGRSKARFFASAGYYSANWRRLQGDILKALDTAEPATLTLSAYGAKYVVPLELIGPLGRRLRITSVWIKGAADPRPRFVTATPRRLP
mgnify:CR=1 FL=1